MMNEDRRLEKRFKRMSRNITKSLFSFDFRRTPPEVMQGTTDEERRIFEALSYYRQKEPRRLALNESYADFESTKIMFTFLDNMPDTLLKILYREVEKDIEALKQIAPEAQTYNQSYYIALYYIVPEILWVHGDDSARSNFFT